MLHAQFRHPDKVDHEVLVHITPGKFVHLFHRHGCQVLPRLLHHIITHAEKVRMGLGQRVLRKGMNLFQDTGCFPGIYLFLRNHGGNAVDAGIRLLVLCNHIRVYGKLQKLKYVL